MAMNSRLAGFAAALLTVLAGAAAQAAGPVCVRPPMPACIDDLTTFVSADRMIDCQNAVKIYTEETMAYLGCRPEGDVPANQALIAAVNRFNCRLMGGENCR